MVVRHVVVFEQLFADIEVARFYFALRALNAARDHASFNRLTLGHIEAVHDGLDALTSKDAHQRIVQAQIKARRTWVTLAARASAQLVVNAARFMALGGDDAQSTQRLHMLVVLGPLHTQGIYFFLLGLCI